MTRYLVWCYRTFWLSCMLPCRLDITCVFCRIMVCAIQDPEYDTRYSIAPGTGFYGTFLCFCLFCTTRFMVSCWIPIRTYFLLSLFLLFPPRSSCSCLVQCHMNPETMCSAMFVTCHKYFVSWFELVFTYHVDCVGHGIGRPLQRSDCWLALDERGESLFLLWFSITILLYNGLKDWTRWMDIFGIRHVVHPPYIGVYIIRITISFTRENL